MSHPDVVNTVLRFPMSASNKLVTSIVAAWATVAVSTTFYVSPGGPPRKPEGRARQQCNSTP